MSKRDKLIGTKKEYILSKIENQKNKELSEIISNSYNSVINFRSDTSILLEIAVDMVQNNPDKTQIISFTTEDETENLFLLQSDMTIYTITPIIKGDFFKLDKIIKEEQELTLHKLPLTACGIHIDNGRQSSVVILNDGTKASIDTQTHKIFK